MATQYEIEEFGEKNTTSYRLFLKQKLNNQEKYVSPFHDISLYTGHSGTYNMVVEIPRWSNAKMEICKTEPFNPIKQDMKNNKLRFVDNCFPYHGYIWNYGALPQTWEMPDFKHPGLEQYKGDNDPIDVIEIGSKVHGCGSVVAVKILGALAMIDEGELDWKLIAIDVNDSLASKLDNLEDLKVHTPGLLKATIDWFRFYKIPNGAKPNKFGFNEEYQNRESAIEVIHIAHACWNRLINNEFKSKNKFELSNTRLVGNMNCLDDEQSNTAVNNFKNTLNTPVIASTEKCEKVFYINKREYLKEPAKGTNKSTLCGSGCCISWLTKDVIVPIAISSIVACVLYYTVQNKN